MGPPCLPRCSQRRQTCRHSASAALPSQLPHMCTQDISLLNTTPHLSMMALMQDETADARATNLQLHVLQLAAKRHCGCRCTTSASMSVAVNEVGLPYGSTTATSDLPRRVRDDAQAYAAPLATASGAQTPNSVPPPLRYLAPWRIEDLHHLLASAPKHPDPLSLDLSWSLLLSLDLSWPLPLSLDLSWSLPLSLDVSWPRTYARRAMSAGHAVCRGKRLDSRTYIYACAGIAAGERRALRGRSNPACPPAHMRPLLPWRLCVRLAIALDMLFQLSGHPCELAPCTYTVLFRVSHTRCGRVCGCVGADASWPGF